MSQTLPQGFQMRRPTMDDLKAVHSVIDKSDLAYLGSSDVTLEELRTDWLAPEFNLQDHLLAQVEQWAQGQVPQARPDARVALHCFVSQGDEPGALSLQHHGFQEIRRSWN